MSGEDIDKIYDKLNTINLTLMAVKTTLVGIPNTSNEGLCGQVAKHSKDISTIKRMLYTLVGLLIGSGVIVASWEKLMG